MTSMITSDPHARGLRRVRRVRRVPRGRGSGRGEVDGSPLRDAGASPG
ncbi:hypothetical protein [Kitasatospora sp. NPDC001527]